MIETKLLPFMNMAIIAKFTSLTLTRPGFFGCSVAGGGLNQPPPEISAVDRAITMKIGTYVTCGVIYQTIKKKKLKFAFLILY